MAMNYAEIMIILQTGVIGAIIVMALGAALNAAQVTLPDGSPQIAKDALDLLEHHNSYGGASFLLLALVVSAALFTRAKVEPLLEGLRGAVRGL
jgi:hypothetical protein